MHTFWVYGLISFDTHIPPVTTTTFPLPQNVLNQSPFWPGLDWPIFYPCRVDLFFPEFHKMESLWKILFCVWLLPLSVFLRFIHVVGCISSLFLSCCWVIPHYMDTLQLLLLYPLTPCWVLWSFPRGGC